MKLLEILLVDDDHHDSGLFAVAVDETGLNIRLQTVADDDQAIDLLEGRGVYADQSRHQAPDLVVLHLDMCLNGPLEFLDWRRASASFCRLPVVIFSALANQGPMEAATARGTYTFIAKPLAFEGWKSVVRRIWDLGMERSEPMQPTVAAGAGRP